MNRVYNFSAGPSMLPEPVLRKAAEEMLDYKGTGMSVMEMSHRSKVYETIVEETEKKLRTLMGIPDSYSVLFLQGGASLQFAMVPMNLMSGSKKADYINTGMFAKKAISDGKLFGTVNVVASSEDKNFSYIPEGYTLSPDADYVHITTNNTIEGTVFTTLPDTGKVPLVADMSSNILSEEMDVTKFGLIYAGAQKNIGPAGLTIVILRNDLLGRHLPNTSAMLRYDVHAKEKSLYNTPSCFSIYMAGLVFDWLEEQGGVKGMEVLNREKAKILYDAIDGLDLYKSAVDKKYRSMMNVTFTTGSEELDDKFVKEAAKVGLTTLKGHRSVGGMRASIYNAMPVEGVTKLVEFMKKFETENQ
jgi:phosphoserine aminotransferase